MNNDAYLREFVSLYSSVSDNRKMEFLQLYSGRQKNPVVAFGFNIWLGFIGVDRFYCGQPGLGVAKLLTLGGLGIWVIIDCFLIGGIAREKSIDQGRKLLESMRA